ncbi:hypothetical protein ETB97_002386 [Aspergillus alliaceus]|uniref:Uncharacterized protein n=1 Tax=Petromyces alliaceus TaxID=209559 RepID=A0A8H6A471_PETAA|nr:hypothetical protein ETB97_002386 [Aspergillus burnettii]
MLAVDNYGKNALHYQLEARHKKSSGGRPTTLASFRYVAREINTLVKQPALPDLAENWLDDLSVRGDEKRRLSLLLLEKGVDPIARNTDGHVALETYILAFDDVYQSQHGFTNNELIDFDNIYDEID